MLESLRLNLFGTAESAGASDRSGPGLFSFGHKDESPADQFASWLPYISYLDEEQLFVNKDGMGFMLEVMPQSGADDRMVDVLVSLYSNCPPDTGVQFHLFASPHICPPLRKYANLRMEDRDQIQKAQAFGRPARNDNLYRKLARRRYAHLSHGAHHSLTQGFHYTIRDFRLMV
ncbi:MAG: TraC family protein, partial [Caldilineaceae bacterium]|nr:TraC family protein [Caldilineaceae bacterium]